MGIHIFDGTLDGLEACGAMVFAGFTISPDQPEENPVGDAPEGGFPSRLAGSLLAQGEPEKLKKAVAVEGGPGAGGLTRRVTSDGLLPKEVKLAVRIAGKVGGGKAEDDQSQGLARLINKAMWPVSWEEEEVVPLERSTFCT